MRHAHNTLQTLIAKMGPNPDPSLMKDLADLLQFYLASNQPPEQIVTPAQAEASHGR